jgi:hypothetical protein
LARLHHYFGLWQALLRHVGVDRILMCLEVLKTPQVHRLACAQLPHDDPHHGVVRTRCEVAIRRFAAEVHELTQHIFNVSS